MEKAGLNTTDPYGASWGAFGVYGLERLGYILYEPDTDASVFAAKVSSFSHEMGKLPGMERGTVSVYEKDVPFLGNYEEVAKVAYEPGESIDEEKLVADIEVYMQNRKVYDFNQSITERWSMSDKGKQKGTEENRVQSVFSLDKCPL